MKRMASLLGGLFLFALIPYGWADSHIPLPVDLKIVAPDENVPKEYARFSGAWSGGKWAGSLPHTLVVEKVDSTGEVVVVYADGDHPRGRFKKRWLRLEGSISDAGKLTLEKLKSGGQATYVFDSDGILRGRFVTAQQNVSKVTLAKSEITQPDSKEEAVNQAWGRYCNGGYCEGHIGRIVSRSEDILTVTINNNTRYIRYSVSGGPGDYSVRMSATGNQGRDHR